MHCRLPFHTHLGGSNWPSEQMTYTALTVVSAINKDIHKLRDRKELDTFIERYSVKTKLGIDV